RMVPRARRQGQTSFFQRLLLGSRVLRKLRRFPRFALGFVTALALGGLATLAACSDHGEGERCQLDNSNGEVESDTDDCADGLVCLSAAKLAIPDIKDTAAREGRCCPLDP